ncbi:hypothetical protein D1P53_001514 [Cryptococcus gattii VGV]|nr:hypothetical protein D1P53_001514 [Cryptococcus gattii VGV]
MGAVWTRLQRIAYTVKKSISPAFWVNPGFFMPISPWARTWTPCPTLAMINPALAGGSHLDMSVYPSVWAMLLAHHHPLNTDKDSKTARVEPRHSTPTPVAIAPSVPKAPSPPPPLTATLSMMSYEADEVTRCIRDGKIESERISWEENRVM